MQIISEHLCPDPCARLKIQIPMHSISWGCPKIVLHCDPISLLINAFGMDFRSLLEVEWKHNSVSATKSVSMWCL